MHLRNDHYEVAVHLLVVDVCDDYFFPENEIGFAHSLSSILLCIVIQVYRCKMIVGFEENHPRTMMPLRRGDVIRQDERTEVSLVVK